MRLALKSFGMAKNVIVVHSMRDVELSISANAKLFLSSSFLGFLKFLDGSSKETFNLGGLKCMAGGGRANGFCQ